LHKGEKITSFLNNSGRGPMKKVITRLICIFGVISLIAAGCGDDGGADVRSVGDSESSSSTSSSASSSASSASSSETEEDTSAPTSGQVEIAIGTVLDLDACPDDWDPYQGVTDDQIRIGTSLPQSGQLAAFGAIGEGMQIYFDFVNAEFPIGDYELVLIAKDDGYEAGRTVANVEEMLETENIIGFAGVIGTPNNFAIRPITAVACVPQLLNLSGFPQWGDPANFPWTVGNILNYATETEIWCQHIVSELGQGATVAGLFMNNDFGKTYQQTLQGCEDRGDINLVAEELHDPAAPDVTNEMTTLIASGAQVLVAGTTAAFCPQTVGTLANVPSWRPMFFMSYTCNNLPAFFAPVQEFADTLQKEGSGVLMANYNKICGDPRYDNDPSMVLTKMVLENYSSVTCADGSYSGGIFFAQVVVDILRAAHELPGGVNRVNVMKATWNLTTINDNLLGTTIILDGTNDAYVTEAAQIQEVQVIDGSLTFTPISDIINTEGEGGSFGE
jgi:ABC-type branched-subunit amino acid transport system substrate-binding protein